MGYYGMSIVKKFLLKTNAFYLFLFSSLRFTPWSIVRLEFKQSPGFTAVANLTAGDKSCHSLCQCLAQIALKTQWILALCEFYYYEFHYYNFSEIFGLYVFWANYFIKVQSANPTCDVNKKVAPFVLSKL